MALYLSDWLATCLSIQNLGVFSNTMAQDSWISQCRELQLAHATENSSDSLGDLKEQTGNFATQARPLSTLHFVVYLYISLSCCLSSLKSICLSVKDPEDHMAGAGRFSVYRTISFVKKSDKLLASGCIPIR